MSDLMFFLAALSAAGLFAGFIGGLFGVGGGVVIVPALFHVFGALDVSDDVRAHAAVATSLATILSTSWRSLSAHRKAGAVDGVLLRGWTPWIAGGAACGAGLAGQSTGSALLGVFGVCALLIAAQMGFGAPERRLGAEPPTGLGRAGLAGGLGFLSAMMGIGGGAFGVTILTLYGRPIHQAVATASGFGATIALPACVLYVVSGWGVGGLPWGSLGYVNLPGFVALGTLTAITAPLGARLAHRLPQGALRRAFAVFLAFMAGNMLIEAFA